jgi:tetratricopeptide (TPR) repeat protein
MHIREIRLSQYFQDLCQHLLLEEYKDFQVLDDSGGDAGNDGYVPSHSMLFAIYCPESTPTKKYYRDKINSDLKKAIKLRDEKGYDIDDWIFLTPAPLPEELHRHISRKAQEAGFKRGMSWSEKHLVNLLAKYPHLRSLFSDLILPDIEAGIKKLVKAHEEHREEIAADLNEIKSIVKTGEEQERKLEGRVAREYERRLDDAKTKTEQAMYLTAIRLSKEILQDLKRDVDVRAPLYFFRALTYWAVSEWNLKNESEAARLFEEAYTYMPDDFRSITNLASAQMLRGDTQAAMQTAERALAMSPGDKNAVIAKANILSKEGRLNEALGYLEENGQPEVKWFLVGISYIGQGRFDEAQAAFREALKLDPMNAGYGDLLAQCILVGRQRALQRNQVLPWKMTPEMRGAHEEAERLLTRAIEAYRKQEVPGKLSAALTNRACARLELGRYQEAISDSREALLLDPLNAVVYVTKARAELRNAQYDAAVESMKRHLELEPNSTSGRRELLDSYVLAGRIEDAKQLVVEELKGDLSEDDLQYIEPAVEVFDLNLEYESADELLKRFEQQFGRRAEILTARAMHHYNTGKEDDVEDLLRQALDVASETAWHLPALKLANILYDRGKYQEALPLYENLVDEQEKSPLSVRYLVCLSNSGRFNEALDFAARIRDGVELDLDVSPIEASIHYTRGNLRRASEIYLALFQRSHGRVEYLVQHGRCLYRLGEPEQAIKAFDQIKNRVTRTDDLLALAQGYSDVGQWLTAIDLAYKALQQDWKDPDVHIAYIMMFFELRRFGNHRKIVVPNVYAEAFEDARDNFNTRFPEAEGFKMVDVREHPEFVYEFLREDELTVEEIYQLYENNKLPVSSKVYLRGREIFDAWLTLTSAKSVGLKGRLGFPEEQQDEERAISSHPEVVVDLLALYTLCRIGKLHLLPKMFDRLYVIQSALDELINTINDETLYVETGHSGVSMVAGQFIQRDVPAEKFRENVRFLEEVKNFIKNECEPVGLQDALEDSDQPLVDVLNPSAAYAAIFARQKGVPLLSDDGLLRLPLSQGYHTQSFSSWALLTYAAAQEHLTEEELHDALLSLLKIEYRYIPVDYKLLLHSARKDGYISGDNFPLAVAELVHPQITILWLAMTAGNFLKELWLLSIPESAKSLLLHELLAVITKKHAPQPTLQTLMAHLHAITQLIPHYFVDIYRQTKQWAKVVHPKVTL